jgi:hypothetical protein
MARWDLAKPCVPENLVLLKEDELELLRALGLAAWSEQHPQAAAFIQLRLQQIAAIFGTEGVVS